MNQSASPLAIDDARGDVVDVVHDLAALVDRVEGVVPVKILRVLLHAKEEERGRGGGEKGVKECELTTTGMAAQKKSVIGRRDSRVVREATGRDRREGRKMT